MPLFSVIVPVYKAQDTLDRCMASILGQTLPDFEVILVDDGSPDASGQICDAYREKDARVQVVHKPNGGPSSARNTGIDHARGEWIVFCDADDEMEKGALELYDRVARETGADVVMGDIIRISPAGTSRQRLFAKDMILECSEDIDRLIQTIICYGFNPWPAGATAQHGYGSPVNRATRRAIIKENELRFNECLRHMEDRLFDMNVCVCSRKIAYIASAVYLYHYNDASLTNMYEENLVVQNEKTIAIFQRFASDRNKIQNLKGSLETMSIERLLMVFRQYVFHQQSPLSFFQKRVQVKRIVARDEYREAVDRVALSALTKFGKITILLIRRRLYGVVALIYELRAALKKG